MMHGAAERSARAAALESGRRAVGYFFLAERARANHEEARTHSALLCLAGRALFWHVPSRSCTVRASSPRKMQKAENSLSLRR
jgi:hypothetical protein